MTSPFIATPASQDPLGGSDNLTTEGGNCYNFTIAGEYDPHLPANGAGNTIQARLLPFPCFNKPPIINNPTLDVPWPTPPPVETGCRPLRARATTTMDEDLPEGLIAEFVDSPAPDKCFPILDLKLNINTIVDQVISIIVPGSGGGGGVIGGIQYNQFGCCCDEYGSFYLSSGLNGDGAPYGSGCYDGNIGSCMGAYMPVGCAGAYDAPAATTGGIGVRWDNTKHPNGQYDADSARCSLIDAYGWSACCAGARSRFEKPQVVGIGTVGEPVGPCIGDGYYVNVECGTTFHGQGAGGDGMPATIEGVEMMNIYEANVGNGYGNCTDGRMVPGIAGTVINASYPANFVPQRICPGTVVTVFGITYAAAGLNGMQEELENSYSVDCSACLAGDNGILMWFQAENAHDMGCNEDEANCDGLAIDDGEPRSGSGKSLGTDTYTAPGTRFGRGDWYQGGGGSNIVRRAGRRDQYKQEQGE